MPGPLEFPGVRRSVIPLVRAGLTGVAELVADGLPGAAPIVGALHELAVPVRPLCRVDAIRLGG